MCKCEHCGSDRTVFLYNDGGAFDIYNISKTADGFSVEIEADIYCLDCDKFFTIVLKDCSIVINKQ